MSFRTLLAGAGFYLVLISCADVKEEPAADNYNYGEDSVDYFSTEAVQQPAHWPASFGFGKRASYNQIKAWDIDVRPDGKGLPAGSGDVTTGRPLYIAKCAACHGLQGEGLGTYSRLVAIYGDTVKAKTIGNYWPYATTVFDYVRRTMPYNRPGSLTDDEVYSLTAYLLYMNKIIDSTTAMNGRSLPKVKMPAQPLYIKDDRKGGPEIR